MRSRIPNWITGVILVLATAALGAQTNTESLLIGPGDTLHVHVFDTPELDQHTRVTDSGELNLLLGGPVKVAGLTPAAAAKVIEEALVKGNLLLHPVVQVTIDESTEQRVSVVGEVHTPGSFVVPTPRTVLEVLALAGGLTQGADRKIIIQRNGTGEKIPYFVSNDPAVAFDSAVKINPGDTVLVPRAGIVYVLGDVKMAGGYTMTNNEATLSVLQLVARAGGTPPTAVPSHARLIRKTANGFTEMPIPLSDMQKGKRPDIPLQADDIIYVPFSYLRNMVVNASGIAASAATAAVYRF